jgi:hypothetical protein
MSLEALAEAIQVDASDIVRTLFMKGIMLSLNQVGKAYCARPIVNCHIFQLSLLHMGTTSAEVSPLAPWQPC